MRLFIGIDFDRETRDKFIQIQEQVGGMITKGKLFDPLNFHLTLRFIGEMPEESIPDIKQAMIKASENTPPFEIMINHLGRFQKKNKNILWLGSQTHSLLNQLHSNLENQLGEEIHLDRIKQSFLPHVTLGRNIQFQKGWTDIKQKIFIPSIKIHISSVKLFHSTRVEGSLRYLPIETIYLNR